MKFTKCFLYLVATGILSFVVGRVLPKHWFHGEEFPYCSYSFEKNGRIYEQLHIKFWQSKVPDMSRICMDLMPQKKLCGTDAEQMNRMIQETCVAELIHILLCFSGLYCVTLWPGFGGVVLALCNILGNLPFILIQRYNRPRLMRLLAGMERRRGRKENFHARSDSELQYG